MAVPSRSQGGITIPDPSKLTSKSNKVLVENTDNIAHMNSSSYKKKFEFSKIMLTLVTCMSLLLTFFGIVYMWMNHDSTLFSYIIGGWFVEFATATGFYYNKAKAENVEKFRQNGMGNYTDCSNAERVDI